MWKTTFGRLFGTPRQWNDGRSDCVGQICRSFGMASLLLITGYSDAFGCESAYIGTWPNVVILRPNETDEAQFLASCDDMLPIDETGAAQADIVLGPSQPWPSRTADARCAISR